ncbi:MAG: FG-GAP-like repeat-containing protein [Chloroflexota bacterium]
MKHRISIATQAFLILVLVSCSSPIPATEKQPTSPPDILPSATAPPMPTPIPSATPGICPPYYSEAQEILRLNLPSDLFGLVPADFNDDGWLDVLVYRGFNQTQNAAPLEILLNDGHGNLYLGTDQVFSESVPSTVAPREAVVADFNGDGRPDIFLADQGLDAPPTPGQRNSIALSIPDGLMVDASANWPDFTDFSHSATAADIDMDGDVDLYVGNTWGENMIPPAIFLNSDGKGTFIHAGGRLPYPLEDLDFGAFTTSEFVDVNNDTFPDLILGDAGDDLEGGPDSHVLLNDGRGYFKYSKNAIPPKPWSDTNSALDIKAADINEDGYQDLLILFTRWEYMGRYIQVLINNQDGTFRDETATRLPQSENYDHWFTWVQLLDINLDGQLDLVTFPSWGDKQFNFYINTGNGFFQEMPNPFGFTSEIFTIFDIDQDGDLDALWTTIYPEEVYYLNRSNGCNTLGQRVTSTPVAAPAPTTDMATTVSPFRDDFNGALSIGWDWIGEDPAHWNLTESPGDLRIILQPDGMGEGEPTNLLVREAPGGNFEITTLVDFLPTSNFQFAGLLIYQSQGNAVQLGRAFAECSVSNKCLGNAIYFEMVEGGASGELNFGTIVKSETQAYLRLRREGTTYTGYYSENGTEWVIIGVHESNIVPRYVGLIAAQAYQSETTADFDYFTIYLLP